MTQLPARGVVKSYGPTPALATAALATVLVTVGAGLLVLGSSTEVEELRTG